MEINLKSRKKFIAIRLSTYVFCLSPTKFSSVKIRKTNRTQTFAPDSEIDVTDDYSHAGVNSMVLTGHNSV